MKTILELLSYFSSVGFPAQAQLSPPVKGNVEGLVTVNACVWACMRVHACVCVRQGNMELSGKRDAVCDK